MQLLVLNGAERDVVDVLRDSALSKNAKKQKKDAVEFLIQCGANQPQFSFRNTIISEGQGRHSQVEQN